MRMIRLFRVQTRLLRLLTVVSAVIVVLLLSGMTQSALSSTYTLWTPIHHREAETYWAQRRGNVTPGVVTAAYSQAAALPQSDILPSAIRRGTSASPDALPPAKTWLQVGPSPIYVGGQAGTYSGRIAALAVDTTTSGSTTVLYAGAANGGVWKSINNGASWTPQTDAQLNNAIGAITIDPVDHNTVYVGTGEPHNSLDSYSGSGIFKTTNGGATWALLGTNTFGDHAGTFISHVLVNPRNTSQVFAASSIGLYVSNNGGSAWSQVSGGLPLGVRVDDVGMDTRVSPIRLYATVRGNGLYRSIDGGTSWQPLTNGIPAGGVWHRSVLAVAPSNPSVIYVMIIDSDTVGNVYVSGFYNGGYFTTNGGDSWSQLIGLNQNFTDGGFGAQGWYDLYLTVDPFNYNIVYGGGVDIAVTTGGTTGGTWNNITSAYGFDNSAIHPDQHALAFAACSAAPCPFYAGNDGGVYFTANSTASDPLSVTYANLNTAGFAIAEFVGGDIGPNFVNRQIALGGTQDNGTVRYDSNPIWPQVFDGDGGFAVIDWTQPHVMYTENYGLSLIKSVDSAQTWNSATSGLGGSSLFYMPYQLDRTHTNHLVAGTTSVYESINGASSWYVSNTNSLNGKVSAVTVAPSSSAIIYAGLTNGSLFKTTSGNSGNASTYASADGIGALAGHYITQIAVDPFDANTAYVVSGNFIYDNFGFVHKTTNGGITWSNISGSLPSYPINSIVLYYSGSTRVLVIGTDVGVYYSTTDGGSWLRLNAGLPNTAVVQLALDPAHSTLLAYTHGRSVWRINIPETAGGSGDTVGTFRPANSTFYLRNSLNAGNADVSLVFGSANALPVAGDWNGDGISTVGLYNTGTGLFSLKDQNTTAAPVVYTPVLGLPNDVPMSGDWAGLGRDGIGTFRTSNGLLYLKINLTSGYADYTMVLGIPGDAPVAGDWDGDGRSSPGVYRPAEGRFYLTNQVCNCAVFGDYAPGLGLANWLPVAGDWTHSGHSGIGVFNPSSGIVYLRNDATTSGYADFMFAFGLPGDKPIAGHWNTASPADHALIVNPEITASPMLPTAKPTSTAGGLGVCSLDGGTGC